MAASVCLLEDLLATTLKQALFTPYSRVCGIQSNDLRVPCSIPLGGSANDDDAHGSFKQLGDSNLQQLICLPLACLDAPYLAFVPQGPSYQFSALSGVESRVLQYQQPKPSLVEGPVFHLPHFRY